MFTGLVEETGRVKLLERRGSGGVLHVRTDMEDLMEGESVAVNGVCQTVRTVTRDCFSCDVLPETMRVTNLGLLAPGALVNLERALRPDGRIGGHIVNGHIDGLGVVASVSRNPIRIGIRVPPGIFGYIVPKGSVAVDGVSLTVGPNPEAGRFDVFIIPHTWERTNLREARIGRKLNIEVDILAKYVERIVSGKTDR